MKWELYLCLSKREVRHDFGAIFFFFMKMVSFTHYFNALVMHVMSNIR